MHHNYVGKSTFTLCNHPQLLRLKQERSLRAFVEDRRATLELVRKTPGLETLPCLLVTWGYLKHSDRSALPTGIHLLDPDDLSAPLARWP